MRWKKLLLVIQTDASPSLGITDDNSPRLPSLIPHRTRSHPSLFVERPILTVDQPHILCVPQKTTRLATLKRSRIRHRREVALSIRNELPLHQRIHVLVSVLLLVDGETLKGDELRVSHVAFQPGQLDACQRGAIQRQGAKHGRLHEVVQGRHRSAVNVVESLCASTRRLRGAEVDRDQLRVRLERGAELRYADGRKPVARESDALEAGVAADGGRELRHPCVADGVGSEEQGFNVRGRRIQVAPESSAGVGADAASVEVDVPERARLALELVEEARHTGIAELGVFQVYRPQVRCSDYEMDQRRHSLGAERIPFEPHVGQP